MSCWRRFDSSHEVCTYGPGVPSGVVPVRHQTRQFAAQYRQEGVQFERWRQPGPRCPREATPGIPSLGVSGRARQACGAGRAGVRPAGLQVCAARGSGAPPRLASEAGVRTEALLRVRTQVELAVVDAGTLNSFAPPAGCERGKLFLQPDLEVVDLLVLRLDLPSGLRHHGVVRAFGGHGVLPVELSKTMPGWGHRGEGRGHGKLRGATIAGARDISDPAGTFTHQALLTIDDSGGIPFASVGRALVAVRQGHVDGVVVADRELRGGAGFPPWTKLVDGDPLSGHCRVVIPVEFRIYVRPGTTLDDVASVLTHGYAALSAATGWR